MHIVSLLNTVVVVSAVVNLFVFIFLWAKMTRLAKFNILFRNMDERQNCKNGDEIC